MRNSQITMLGGLGIVLVGVVVVVAMLRFALVGTAAGDAEFERPARSNRTDTTQETRNLSGFTEIEVHRSWSVVIERGDRWSVALSYPEGREEDLDVAVRGNRLILEATDEPRPWSWHRDNTLEARITMPELAGIHIEGAASVEFSGLSGSNLDVSIAGAAHVEGRDGGYDHLNLTLGGAGHVDLSRLPVTNANVDLSGASHVALDMAGGELSGQMSGFGNLTYSGNVIEENVNVSGFGRVGRE